MYGSNCQEHFITSSRIQKEHHKHQKHSQQYFSHIYQSKAKNRIGITPKSSGDLSSVSASTVTTSSVHNIGNRSRAGTKDSDSSLSSGGFEGFRSSFNCVHELRHRYRSYSSGNTGKFLDIPSGTNNGPVVRLPNSTLVHSMHNKCETNNNNESLNSKKINKVEMGKTYATLSLTPTTEASTSTSATRRRSHRPRGCRGGRKNRKNKMTAATLANNTKNETSESYNVPYYEDQYFNSKPLIGNGLQTGPQPNQQFYPAEHYPHKQQCQRGAEHRANTNHCKNRYDNGIVINVNSIKSEYDHLYKNTNHYKDSTKYHHFQNSFERTCGSINNTLIGSFANKNVQKSKAESQSPFFINSINSQVLCNGQTGSHHVDSSNEQRNQPIQRGPQSSNLCGTFQINLEGLVAQDEATLSSVSNGRNLDLATQSQAQQRQFTTLAPSSVACKQVVEGSNPYAFDNRYQTNRNNSKILQHSSPGFKLDFAKRNFQEPQHDPPDPRCQDEDSSLSATGLNRKTMNAYHQSYAKILPLAYVNEQQGLCIIPQPSYQVARVDNQAVSTQKLEHYQDEFKRCCDVAHLCIDRSCSRSISNVDNIANTAASSPSLRNSQKFKPLAVDTSLSTISSNRSNLSSDMLPSTKGCYPTKSDSDERYITNSNVDRSVHVATSVRFLRSFVMEEGIQRQDIGFQKTIADQLEITEHHVSNDFSLSAGHGDRIFSKNHFDHYKIIGGKDGVVRLDTDCRCIVYENLSDARFPAKSGTTKQKIAFEEQKKGHCNPVMILPEFALNYNNNRVILDHHRIRQQIFEDNNDVLLSAALEEKEYFISDDHGPPMEIVQTSKEACLHRNQTTGRLICRDIPDIHCRQMRSYDFQVIPDESSDCSSTVSNTSNESQSSLDEDIVDAKTMSKWNHFVLGNESQPIVGIADCSKGSNPNNRQTLASGGSFFVTSPRSFLHGRAFTNGYCGNEDDSTL